MYSLFFLALLQTWNPHNFKYHTEWRAPKPPVEGAVLLKHCIYSKKTCPKGYVQGDEHGYCWCAPYANTPQLKKNDLYNDALIQGKK